MNRFRAALAAGFALGMASLAPAARADQSFYSVEADVLYGSSDFSAGGGYPGRPVYLITGFPVYCGDNCVSSVSINAGAYPGLVIANFEVLPVERPDYLDPFLGVAYYYISADAHELVQINGPDYGYIPIDVSYDVTFEDNGAAVADAEIAVNGYVGVIGADKLIEANYYGNPSGLYVLNAETLPNTIFSVDYLVDVQGSPGATPIDITAIVDPVVAIDPSFAAVDPNYLKDYTIDTFGVPNVFGGGGGVVPEPATWTMLIAGFGMIGLAVRRRVASAA
jgi:hypothetical protein